MGITFGAWRHGKQFYMGRIEIVPLFIPAGRPYVSGMTGSLIRHEHERLGAHWGTLNGSEVVLDYGDRLAEHEALWKSAGVIDLSFRGRLCLTGSDRIRFLHGQVTNDVKKLAVGQGCYAALVNAKGKIESDLNIYSLENELLLDFEPGLTQSLLDRFDKFIIADDVQVTDVGGNYGLLSVQGPLSDVVIQKAGLNWEIPIEALSFTSLKHPSAGEFLCMKNARGPAAGFDLFVPAESLSEVFGKLLIAAKTEGGRASGWEALEIARIEAGIPRFGQDMDATNLASECGIEQRAISYSKGCYIGQEVISRIRAYGQVAKALRGLRLEASAAKLPGRGDKIVFNDKEVGYVTSAIHSEVLEANLALGYVRREHNEAGTLLQVRSGDQLVGARIVELPFRKE